MVDVLLFSFSFPTFPVIKIKLTCRKLFYWIWCYKFWFAAVTPHSGKWAYPFVILFLSSSLWDLLPLECVVNTLRNTGFSYVLVLTYFLIPEATPDVEPAPLRPRTLLSCSCDLALWMSFVGTLQLPGLQWTECVPGQSSSDCPEKWRLL